MIRLLPDLPLPTPDRGPFEGAAPRTDFAQLLQPPPAGPAPPNEVALPEPVPSWLMAQPVPQTTALPVAAGPTSWLVAAGESSFEGPGPDGETPEAGPTPPPATDPRAADLVQAPAPDHAGSLAASGMSSPPPGDGHGVVVWRMAAPANGEVLTLFASPWQLMSGPHLSRTTRGDHGHATGLTITPPAPAEATRFMATESPLIQNAPRAIQDSPLQVGRHGPVRSIDAQDRPGNADDVPVSAPSGSTTGGAPVPWPIRLLRWLNAGEQGPVAWLRDFTVDPAVLPSLITEIRRFAQSENIPLRRIVLNGQTIWTTETPSTRTTAKVSP